MRTRSSRCRLWAAAALWPHSRATSSRRHSARGPHRRLHRRTGRMTTPLSDQGAHCSMALTIKDYSLFHASRRSRVCVACPACLPQPRRAWHVCFSPAQQGQCRPCLPARRHVRVPRSPGHITWLCMCMHGNGARFAFSPRMGGGKKHKRRLPCSSTSAARRGVVYASHVAHTHGGCAALRLCCPRPVAPLNSARPRCLGLRKPSDHEAQL